MSRFNKILSTIGVDPLERGTDGSLILRTVYFPPFLRARAVTVTPGRAHLIRLSEFALLVIQCVLCVEILSDVDLRDFWPFVKFIALLAGMRMLFRTLVTIGLPPTTNVLSAQEYRRKQATEGSGLSLAFVTLVGLGMGAFSLTLLLQPRPIWVNGILMLGTSVLLIVIGVRALVLRGKLEDESSAGAGSAPSPKNS